MINNPKVKQFVAKANERIQGKVGFKYPSHEQLHERMMRLGIEARALDVTNEEELEEVALATLKNDFCNGGADA